MKTIKVKTIWQGTVAIRDKYVADRQPILIKHGNDTMEMSAEDLAEKMVSKSGKPYQDKFSERWHYLCYYKWKPNKQQKLI